MNTPAQIISRAREARAKLKDGHIRLSQALTELNDISAKDIAEQTDQLGVDEHEQYMTVSNQDSVSHESDDSYNSDEEMPLVPLVPTDDGIHSISSPVRPLDRPLPHLFTASSLRREATPPPAFEPEAPGPLPEESAPVATPPLGWRMFGVGPAAEHVYQVYTKPSQEPDASSSPLTISPTLQAPSAFQFGIPIPSPSTNSPSPPSAGWCRSPSGRLIPSQPSPSPSSPLAGTTNSLQLPPPRVTSSERPISPAEALSSLLSDSSKKTLSLIYSSPPPPYDDPHPPLALEPYQPLGPTPPRSSSSHVARDNNSPQPSGPALLLPPQPSGPALLLPPPSTPSSTGTEVVIASLVASDDLFRERSIENLYPLSPVSKEHYMMSNPLFSSSNRTSLPAFKAGAGGGEQGEGMLKKIVDRIQLHQGGSIEAEGTTFSPTAITLSHPSPPKPYLGSQELGESSYDEDYEEGLLPLPSPSRDSRGSRRPRPVTGGGGGSSAGASSPVTKQQKLRDRRTTVERAVQADLYQPAPGPPSSVAGPHPSVAGPPSSVAGPHPSASILTSRTNPGTSKPPMVTNTNPHVSFFGPGSTANDFFKSSGSTQADLESVDAPKKLASDFFRGVSSSTQPLPSTLIFRDSPSSIIARDSPSSIIAPPPPPLADLSQVISKGLSTPSSPAQPSLVDKAISPSPRFNSRDSPSEKISKIDDDESQEIDPPPIWSPPTQDPKDLKGATAEASSFTAALEEAEGGEDALSLSWSSLVKGEGDGKVPDVFKTLLEQLAPHHPPPVSARPPPPRATSTIVSKDKTREELMASRSPALVSLGDALESVLKPRVLLMSRPKIKEADVTKEVFKSWRIMTRSLPPSKGKASKASKASNSPPQVPAAPPPNSLLSSLLKSGLLSSTTDSHFFSTDLPDTSASRSASSARRRGGLMMSSILMGSPVPQRGPPSTFTSSSSVLTTNIKPPLISKKESLLDLSFYGLSSNIQVS